MAGHGRHFAWDSLFSFARCLGIHGQRWNVECDL